MLTYMASKVAAEKALWKFAGEQRPHFTISSVGPSVIIGEALNKAHNEGDGPWIRALYDGNTAFWDSMPASKFDAMSVAQRVHSLYIRNKLN